ncbi:MAG: hypothetical protein HUK20_10140 [Fibrobacter sp.]|nr:hypothetical protein [Fibrobacter sp.]
MDFSLFAQLLKPLLGKGQNQDEFVQKLFYAIVSFPQNQNFINPLDSVNYSLYRLYFIGKRRINELAYKICGYADREIFRDYILKQNDEVQLQLCKSFKPFIQINKKNVPEKLADLFYKIIFEAAKEKGKRLKKPKGCSKICVDTNDDFLEIKESLSHIVSVLSNLKNTPNEGNKLKMNAVCVSKKIDDVLLQETVTHCAVVYYKTIQNFFKDISKSKGVNFDDIATIVKYEYKWMKSKGMTQNEIYHSMVQWFSSITNSSNRTACSVIVSFFVQNCEVFDAATK